MEIKTKALGTVSILEKQIIELEQGFYGFAEYHRFALIDAPQKPFIWVQSMDSAELAFLAIDPFIFMQDYEIDVEDSMLAPLSVESPSDVVVLSLVTIPQDGGPVTANLQGPLIINKKNNKALQAILTDPRWSTKHSLVPDTAGKRGS